MRNPTAQGSLNPTQQRTGSRTIEKPCAYWPSKSSMRIQKPFRMISLQKISQQLPWIDILTKNTGGWGCIPTHRAWSESSRPSFTDSTSTGAGCTCSPCDTGAGCTCSPCDTGAGCTWSPCDTGAGSTWSPCNTGAGSTWSPCNNRRATPSAFLHKQLDVTWVLANRFVTVVACLSFKCTPVSLSELLSDLVPAIFAFHKCTPRGAYLPSKP